MEKQPHVIKCRLFSFRLQLHYEGSATIPTIRSKKGLKIIGIGVNSITDTIEPNTNALTHFHPFALFAVLAEQTSIIQPMIRTGTMFATQNGKPIQQRKSLIQSNTNPHKHSAIIAKTFIRSLPSTLVVM